MSKELTPLEALGNINGYLTKYFNRALNRPEDTIIKWTEIEIIEKSLKALEIIKEKLVNLFIVAHTDSKEAYNDMVSEHWRELTQEEYDLLKEVLL